MPILKRKYTGKSTCTTKKRRYTPKYPRYRNVVYQNPRHELKANNLHDSGTMSATGQVVLVSGIGAGNDINQRSGREIKIDKIAFNHAVKHTATSGMQFGHVWLIYDKAANGILPNFANIFIVADEFTAPRVDQQWRYNILYHKTFNLGVATTVMSDKATYFTDDMVKVNKRAQYLDTGTGIGDIATGAIYLCYIASDVNSTIYYNINTQFIDV